MSSAPHIGPVPAFVWGAATSAYQIEGAVAEDGRGISIWDTFCRRPGKIADGSNADVACDHYHRVDEDLELMSSLGLQAYRFSVAWPRVQPQGAGPANGAGLDFYDRLVDGLLARGIEPHLTLYHWDLPQALQDGGGWGSRETVDRFADYAMLVLRRLGDRVRHVATLNEPWVVATLGHETGVFAPGLTDRRVAMQASHHLLLAHGTAVQALRAHDPRLHVGMVLNQAPTHAFGHDEADRARARLEDGLLVRWYMDPLLHGRYPQDVLDFLGADAPHVAAADLPLIATPIDFLGLNYYTRNRFDARGPAPMPASAAATAMQWEIYPEGLEELLLRLHADYKLPPLYITENGAAFDDRLDGGRVADAARIDYLRRHIDAVESARRRGVDVRGYFVWSLFDNFEWAHGLGKRFGIVHVDYASGARLPKDSAWWYRDFIRSRRASAPGPHTPRDH